MEQRSYKIYKVCNTINDMVYIGQTVGALKNRFNQHCKCSNSKLGKAIRELGKDKFRIELLDASASSIKELGALEDTYITLCDSINNGYNIRPGSQSSADLNKILKSTAAITLDEEVLKLVKDLAEKESRTVSSQINKMLKDYFAKGK